jgi:hypothetical protein
VQKRHLAPQFLAAVGPVVVAVDRVQPVAATVSPSGEVLDVVSWAELVAPPSLIAWPNRRIAIEGAGIVVQDLPDAQPVAVSVSPDGSLAAGRGDPAATWRHPRLYSAIPKSVGPWEFTTHRDGYRLNSEVAHGGTWSDVRPWEFTPWHELVLVDGRSAVPKPAPIAPIDISDRCWPSSRADELLSDYLMFTFGNVAAVRKRGARDVRVHVAGFEANPIIEVEFGLDIAPGERFVRRDELGNLAGLAFWNIIFDDEDFDLLAEGPVDDQGRIVV